MPRHVAKKKGHLAGALIVHCRNVETSVVVNAGKLRVTLSGAGEPVIRDGLFCLLSKNFHHAPNLLKCLDQSFNVAARVVKIKTCPARRIEP